MRRARDIFPFNVFEEIEKGNSVYAVNKAYPADGTLNVNEIPTEYAVHLIKGGNAVFWVLEIGEETNNG